MGKINNTHPCCPQRYKTKTKRRSYTIRRKIFASWLSKRKNGYADEVRGIRRIKHWWQHFLSTSQPSAHPTLHPAPHSVLITRIHLLLLFTRQSGCFHPEWYPTHPYIMSCFCVILFGIEWEKWNSMERNLQKLQKLTWIITWKSETRKKYIQVTCRKQGELWVYLVKNLYDLL